MNMIRRIAFTSILLFLLVFGERLAAGQILSPGGQNATPNPFSDSTVKPGKAILFDLEAQFAKATAEGGGKAFATWFA